MKGFYIFRGKCIGPNKKDLDIIGLKFDGKYFYFIFSDGHIKITRSEFLSEIYIED